MWQEVDDVSFQTTIELAGAGDGQAINTLRSNYNRMLVRFLRAKAPGRSDELIRQTWLVIGRRLRRFVGGERRFRILLLSTALEQASRYSPRGQLAAWTPNGAGPDQDLVGDDPVTDAAIASLLAGLRPLQADILLLRIVGGLSASETASVLRTNLQQVRQIEVGSLNQIARRLADLTRSEQLNT